MVRIPDNREAESRKSPEYQGKTAQKLAQYGLGPYHVDGNEPVGEARSQHGPQKAEYHIDAEYDD